MDETDYTSGLRGAVEDYIEVLGQTRGQAHTPGNQVQSVKWWESARPHDLIAWLSNGNLLVLEVKLQTKRRLLSPYPLQYELNQALEEAGHPIRYCFNWDAAYGNRAAYLDRSQACRPSVLFEKEGQLNIDTTMSLRRLIDELASRGTPAGNTLAQLIARGSFTELSQLSGATILVISHAKDRWLVESLDWLIRTLQLSLVPLPRQSSMKEQVQHVIAQAERLASQMLVEGADLQADPSEEDNSVQEEDNNTSSLRFQM